jgi:CheY-like chemotaxis protein
MRRPSTALVEQPAPLARVLVVDDAADILGSLAEILELEGCEVQRARNGEEALAVLAERPADVILQDLVMPGRCARSVRRPGSASRSTWKSCSSGCGRCCHLDDAGRRSLRCRPVSVVPITRSTAEGSMSAKDILENQIPELLKTKPELAKDINAVINFNITGADAGSWTLDCTKTENWVSSGTAENAKMTITVAAEDFVKIRAKQLNPQMAAMQGKLKFKPMDMGLAMKLGKLLG